VAVVLATRHPRIAEFHCLSFAPLPLTQDVVSLGESLYGEGVRNNLLWRAHTNLSSPMNIVTPIRNSSGT